jgi:tetratricopeptide (TPR) repeat protein
MLTSAPLLLLAFALQAPDDAPEKAEDFFTLGRDHAKFARDLYKAGFVDLAENLCTRIENSTTAEPDEVASVRSVHLDLKIEQARLESDPRAKLASLSQLLKAKEEFIDAYPDAPEALSAQQTLPDVYAAVGEAYSKVLEAAGDDPSEAKRLRGEGSDVFRRGEQALADRIEGLRAALEDTTLSEPDIEALNVELMTSLYNLARTFYFHATLLGADDPFGKTFFERSIEAFSEFGLEFSDRLLYYEGWVFQGLASQKLGLTDDALLCFDLCIELKDTFAPGEALPSSTIAVIAWGVREKISLLNELKRYDESIAVANDFLENVEGVAESRQDVAILDARMTAEVESGRSDAVLETARLLDQKDQRGFYGSRARDMLGKLGGGGGAGVDQKNLLRIAQSLNSKKDHEQAIKLCNQAIAAGHAGGKPGEELTDAFILLGGASWSLDRLEEASIAYDAAYDSNPAALHAADALYSASRAFDELYKLRRQPFFEKRADERLQQLATKFPRHPKAAEQALKVPRKLGANDEFYAAAQAYQKIPADSPVYPDAQFGAATNLYKEVARLAKEDAAKAKALAAEADTQLRKAQKVLEGAAAKTLDLEEKARLERSAFMCLSTIGNLYMLEAVGRQNDVLALTKEIEEKYASDEEKVGEARALRVRALTAAGKVQEAKDFLEGLLAADPGSRSAALAAGVLARTFDQQYEKDKDSPAGDDLWKQAYRYYVLSIKPKLNDSGASTEIQQVADRLMLMGEHFNDVPEGVNSFVGLPPDRKPVAPEYWEDAAEFYEAVVSVAGTTGRINLARALGYLGRYEEAIELYSQVVENESLIDPSAPDVLNRSVLASRPELLSAYLELGVAQFLVGKAERDTATIQNSIVIFGRIVKTAPKMTSEAWWRARYYQVAGWDAVGSYPQALAAINDLARNSNDYDEGKYGLNARFKELKRELERKVPK